MSIKNRTYSDYTPAEKAVLREMLLCDLSFFIRFFFKQIEGSKFLLNWHHKSIASHLTKVYEKEIQNLIINIPPRHSKTTMSVYFTAWCLAKNPKSLFLYISASDKLTNDNSRLVRSIITSYPFKELFGVSISPDTTAKGHWRTNKGGGITTATINGQITGFGAGAIEDEKKFYGAIIIDDPNKPNAEGSDLLSETPNERFNDTIRSRRNGAYTPIILIQQRVFEMDLSGFLMDGKGGMNFKVLKLPVMSEGVPLWAKKMDLEEIKALEKHPDTAHIFQSQYMQDPKDPKGLAFPLNKINQFTLSEINKSVEFVTISVIDTADTGSDSYADGTFLIDGEKAYLIDVIFNNDCDLFQNKDKTLANFIKHETTLGVIETNKEGSSYINQLRNESSNITLYGKHSKGRKNLRINAEKDFIIKHFMFKNDYEHNSDYAKFMRELTKYNLDGKNKHDDAADMTALASQFIRQRKLIS